MINVFRFRTKISVSLLEDIIREIFSILIFLKLDYQSYIKAYDISIKMNSSVYDCIYITMSDKYKAPFITADKKLYNSAKGLNFNVIFLDDIISI